MKNKLALTVRLMALLVVLAAPAAHAYVNSLNGMVNSGRWYVKTLSLGPNPGTRTPVDVRITGGTAMYPPAQWHMYLVDDWGRVVAYGHNHVHANMLGYNCRLYIYNAGGRNAFQAQVIVEYSPTPWGGSS